MDNYKLELIDGKRNVYSEKIGINVMEDAAIDEVKMALAREMEYGVKLNMVKLLMTFPHGFYTMDDKVIVHQDALDAYNIWHNEIYQRIGFMEEYYSLIDEKIREILI